MYNLLQLLIIFFQVLIGLYNNYICHHLKKDKEAVQLFKKTSIKSVKKK